MQKKKKKSWENIDIGRKVLVLAKRIWKKSAPGKVYKQSVQNIAYFNEEQAYVIKPLLGKVVYYWVKNSKNNINLTKRFQRKKLFALKTTLSCKFKLIYVKIVVLWIKTTNRINIWLLFVEKTQFFLLEWKRSMAKVLQKNK